MKRYFAALSALVFVLVGLALFMQANTVYACSIPTPNPEAPTPVPYSLENQTEDSDFIFVGTVVSLSDVYSSYFVEAEIEVEQYLKGEGSRIVRVTHLATESTCGGVAIGKSYIFFTRGTINDIMENFNRELYGSEWIDSGNAWSAREENIERVIAVTNQSIAPYPMPLNQQIERTLSDGKTIWTIVSVILVSVVTGLFAMLRMRIGGRKSKAKG